VMRVSGPSFAVNAYGAGTVRRPAYSETPSNLLIINKPISADFSESALITQANHSVLQTAA
jgi:hypothetical protein